VEQHWTVLEAYMRTQHLETSKAAEKTSTEEWVHEALALLKADLSLIEMGQM
jgi:hypothetical protein